MGNFIINDNVLIGYSGEVPENLIIPDNVVKIDDYAFRLMGNEYGFDLICNAKLRTIGKKAFESSSCKRVVLNDSLECVCENAFINSSIKELINKGNPKIEADAFASTYYLREYSGTISKEYITAFKNSGMYAEENLIINDYEFNTKHLIRSFSNIYSLFVILQEKTFGKLSMKLSMSLLIELNNMTLLKEFLNVDLFNCKIIDYGINLAIKQKHYEMQVLLIDYKNKHGWIKSIEDTVKEKFSLEDGETSLF